MAQQERAIRTRRAVIEAAASVFAERGYAAATMAEILQQAGVTKGALYFHFESKEVLAQAVINAQVDTELWMPRELKLQEWVDVGMTLAHRIPDDVILLAGIRLSADMQGRSRFGSAWPAWIGLVTGLLAQAKERGEVLPHVDPVETAECFLGAWVGTQLVSETESRWSDLGRRISVLYNHVLPAVATPAALVRLDTAPDRGARVLAELQEAAADRELVAVQA
ncbi:ScbR family autoregulator-binding transcription factor [Streptomyces kunmingensis]|uniref:ScbR family autoregulator-binding transcription factor n=1 Tax=Streptomyces kunmingensis TaxID=68225 RepID=A0ABU6C942_9ACTN|nr:ScbR family autoregulator-binding transcription factor [Streptomyces kunmingensis]MEB3960677.1 ScbR family autoregulator-binding transcription factor [Streptomyces kunmingensis]